MTRILVLVVFMVGCPKVETVPGLAQYGELGGQALKMAGTDWRFCVAGTVVQEASAQYVDVAEQVLAADPPKFTIDLRQCDIPPTEADACEIIAQVDQWLGYTSAALHQATEAASTGDWLLFVEPPPLAECSVKDEE